MTFKPKKKIRTIKAEYFSCGRDGHFHKTERVATNCHKKRGKAKPSFAERRKQCIAAIDMYVADESFAAIGRNLGVSSSSASTYIYKALEIVFTHDDQLITLPDGTIGKMPRSRTVYGKDGGRSHYGHKLYVRHVSNYQKCVRPDQIKPLAEKQSEVDEARGWSDWRLERTLADGLTPLCEMTEAQVRAIPTTTT